MGAAIEMAVQLVVVVADKDPTIVDNEMGVVLPRQGVQLEQVHHQLVPSNHCKRRALM